MDAILETLSGNLPQTGVGAIVIFIISLLVKLLIDEKDKHASTRTSVQAELDAQSARHRTELDALATRLQTEMDQDVTRYRQDRADALGQLATERLRNAELVNTIDIERRARYEAEYFARNGQMPPRWTAPYVDSVPELPPSGRHQEGSP